MASTQAKSHIRTPYSPSLLPRLVRDRTRKVLGVWAPMALGLVLIVMAVNFLLFAPASPPDEFFVLDPTASFACGGSVLLIGGLLILSTYGRWRKVRAARGGP